MMPINSYRQKYLITAVSLALFTPMVAAQDQTSLEEVVVTTSRTETPLSQIPNTITMIDQQDLRQQININNDLSTILGNMVPSFSPSRQKMTSAGESLRGRSPLYMVDGVPQSNPLRDGSRDGHTIDPLMLERVEVIHGANAIHGLGASGGIINLITRRPSEQWQQSLRVESFAQEEDLGESAGFGANYSVSGRTDAIDVLASVSWRKSGINYDADGNIIGVDNTQGDTMDAETRNAFLKFGYNWGQQRLELTVNDYKLEGSNDWVSVSGDKAAGIAATSVKGDMPGLPATNDVTLFSLGYSHQDFLGHKVSLQAFDQEFAGTYGGGTFGTFQDPAFGDNIYDQSQNNSNKQGLKLTLSLPQLADQPVSLAYGADYLNDETYQLLALTGREWVPTTNYDNLAVFAQADFTGIENLTITVGARHERSTLEVDDFITLYTYGAQSVKGGEPDFSDTLGNVGATYKITDEWRVYASYAESFSMPDVGRVLRGINTPGQDVASFLDLKPITTENTEFGLEYNDSVISAQLSAYTSDSDFGQRLQPDADGIYSVKRERTEIAGIEFRSQWVASESDVLGLRYAQTDGEYDSDGDNRVDTDLGGNNISPDRLNLSWDRQWSTVISSRLQVNVVMDRDFKNSSGVTASEFDGYTTVDFYGEYDIGMGTVSLGLQNLTNEDYFTYYAQTAGNDARNFKGIGRSFSLSYAMQF